MRQHPFEWMRLALCAVGGMPADDDDWSGDA